MQSNNKKHVRRLKGKFTIFPSPKKTFRIDRSTDNPVSIGIQVLKLVQRLPKSNQNQNPSECHTDTHLEK